MRSRQWLKHKDPDVHGIAEATAWYTRFEEVEWRWNRGHPELRKSEDEYDQHNWANVLCDRIVGLQYNRWPASSLRRD